MGVIPVFTEDEAKLKDVKLPAQVFIAVKPGLELGTVLLQSLYLQYFSSSTCSAAAWTLS